MVTIYIYHLKRLIEFCFKAFSNRRIKGFKNKFSATRTLCKLYLRSLGKNKDTETSVKFFEFIVTGLNPASLLYLFQEIFLEREYYFETHEVKPKIIDCGANIGVSILYFKKLFPLSEIIAIEPNPTAFRLLEKNIRDNGIQGVKLLNCCVSDHEGIEKFYFEKGGTNNLSGSIFEARGNEFEMEVESVKLSSVVNKEMFDLIKIDVEGAERQIFKDLTENNLLSSSKQYFLEYHHHPQMENVFVKMLDSFEKEGFKFSIRAGFLKPGFFQDIFIAFVK